MSVQLQAIVFQAKDFCYTELWKQQMCENLF